MTENRHTRRRVAVGVLASASILGLACAGPDGGRRLPSFAPGAQPCATEDEVPVAVAVGSFGLERGDVACVHVDWLEPVR